MTKATLTKSGGLAGSVFFLMALAAPWAQAQTSAIGVGKAAPVAPNQGLLGTYYNFGTGDATPPGGPPGDPDPASITATGANIVGGLQNDCVQFLQKIDGPLTINFQTTPPAGANAGPNNFMAVWSGFIKIPTTQNYNFGVSSDDGERTWIGTLTGTPLLNHWVQRGAPAAPGDVTAAIMENAGLLPVLIEYEQGNGGTTIQVQWNPGGAGYVDIPVANLVPPNGPNAATVTALASANGGNPVIAVNWTPAAAGVAATDWILARATVTGGVVGAYSQIAVQTGTTFVDMTAVPGTVYSYIVQGTAINDLLIGSASTAVQCAILVTVNPLLLQVAENGGQASFTVTLAITPTGTVTIPITSGNAAALTLTGPNGTGGMINLTFNAGSTGAALTQTVTVTGLQRFVEGNPTVVNVTFGQLTCTDPTSPYAGYNAGGTAILPVVVTIISDGPGIILNPPSGLSTSNGGASVSFTVQLATTPTATVILNLTVDNPTLATVAPTQITILAGTAPTPIPVLVTPTNVNTQTTYIAPYNIIVDPSTSLDTEYQGLAAAVEPINTAVNLPPLKHVWKCGLIGGEVLIALGLLNLWRRSRRGLLRPL